MSETGEGNGNGKERVTLPLEALRDELVITFDRRDGSMTVGGKVINLEVALDMCNRAARHFEQQIRLQTVAAARQQLAEQAQTAQLLQTIKGGRG